MNTLIKSKFHFLFDIICDHSAHIIILTQSIIIIGVAVDIILMRFIIK